MAAALVVGGPVAVGPIIGGAEAGPRNLLTSDQQTFERSLGGWLGQQGTSVRRSDDAAYQGRRSMRVRASRSTAGTPATIVASTLTGRYAVGVRAGGSYSGSVQVRSGSRHQRPVQCALAWYRTDGSLLTMTAGAAQSETSGQWTRAQCSGVAPTGAARAALRVIVTGAASAETHYADDAWLTDDTPATTTTTAAPATAPTTAPTTTVTSPPTTAAPATTAPPTTAAPATTAPPTTAAPTTSPPPPSPPSSTGFPGASNTGVPDGTRLAPSGSITTTHNGQVLDALDVNGQIRVLHDNVVIRRTRVRNAGAEAIWQDPNRRGLVVEDCELDGSGNGSAASAVAFANYTIRRCDVHHYGEGLAAFGGVTVEDNWFHDFTNYISQGAHQDGIQVEYGDNVLIRHNTIMQNVDGANAAIWVSAGQPHNNVVIENNLVAGASFAIGAGSQPGVRVINNRVSTVFYPNGGWYGPFTYTSGSQLSGNVWHESGQRI